MKAKKQSFLGLIVASLIIAGVSGFISYVSCQKLFGLEEHSAVIGFLIGIFTFIGVFTYKKHQTSTSH